MGIWLLPFFIFSRFVLGCARLSLVISGAYRIIIYSEVERAHIIYHPLPRPKNVFLVCCSFSAPRLPPPSLAVAVRVARTRGAQFVLGKAMQGSFSLSTGCSYFSVFLFGVHCAGCRGLAAVTTPASTVSPAVHAE